MENELNITQMSGAGNTFLVLDLRKKGKKDEFKNFHKLSENFWPQIARFLCQSKKKWLSDGFVVLKPSQKNKEKHFFWNFYNADGSWASMCGNAARCVARYVYDTDHIEECVLENSLGCLQAQKISKDHVKVEMPPITKIKRNQKIKIKPPSQWKLCFKTQLEKETIEHTNSENKIIDAKKFYFFTSIKQKNHSEQTTDLSYSFINSGVPHVVVSCTHMQDKVWEQIADQIRNHQKFSPEKTNFTLYTPQGDQCIHSMTYERGVQKPTQACGTGAVAATIVHFHNTNKLEQTVFVPGGKLIIKLGQRKPWLIGPTEYLDHFAISQKEIFDFLEKV